MPFDNTMRDRQAQACPLRFSAKEGCKQLPQDRLGDACTLVLDRGRNSRIIGLYGDVNGATRLHGLQGVDQDIQKDLLHLCPIDLQGW